MGKCVLQVFRPRSPVRQKVNRSSRTAFGCCGCRRNRCGFHRRRFIGASLPKASLLRASLQRRRSSSRVGDLMTVQPSKARLRHTLSPDGTPPSAEGQISRGNVGSSSWQRLSTFNRSLLAVDNLCRAGIDRDLQRALSVRGHLVMKFAAPLESLRGIRHCPGDRFQS